MFRKMPIILLAVIFGIILLGPYLPITIKEGMYAVSLTIKSVIVSLLPIVVFSLLFKAISSLSKSASKIIGIILFFVVLSNLLSTFLSQYVGMMAYCLDLSVLSPQNTLSLSPLWSFELPQIMSNDKAMFSGIVLGFLINKMLPALAVKMTFFLEKTTGYILNMFIYLIPLFVSGFIVKLQYDGVITLIIREYTAIFVLVATAQFAYILLCYFLLNNCNPSKTFQSIRNMFPAALSGFTTMSSAASMPLTMLAASNNANNKELAPSVVAATVNIHLVGDCFAIPIFAYAVLKSFGLEEPSFITYMSFALFFVFAKFSVAAIPGGGILVMLPILERYLNFSSDMMSLITALYILFDPVITAANVLGNGAFSKMIDKTVELLQRKNILSSNV